MMSDEKFFGHVRQVLHDYAPEVPAGVYGQMRRRVWMGQFLRFRSGQLNIWYLLLAGTLAAGVWLATGNEPVQAMGSDIREIRIPPSVWTAACAGGQERTTSSPRKSCGMTCASTNKAENILKSDAGITDPSPTTTPGASSGAEYQAITGEQQAQPSAAPQAADVKSAPKGRKMSPPIFRDKK